ncbi:MAG TPA: hypothetical protein VKG92_00520 [Flavobacteriales bacterium]|nr:hypothetical protein [Flavobacteriales bacterium]
MTDISQLVGGPDRGNGVDNILFGLVSKAPAGGLTGMTVIVPSFSSEHAYEVLPGRWPPRGLLLPQQNDQCLVILDEHGDAWVPVWSPRSTRFVPVRMTTTLPWESR